MPLVGDEESDFEEEYSALNRGNLSITCYN